MKIGGLHISDTELLTYGGIIALIVVFGPQITKAMASQIVKAGGGVITGAVTGAGDVIGIPATNMTQCERDIAEGHTWDASFDCPASDFLRYVLK